MHGKNVLRASLGLATAVALAGCAPAAGEPEPGAATPVVLQLQWVAQAQFAGYYAAVDQGYYADEGLDVTIQEAGTDTVPIDVLAAGDADYAISWVPKVLIVENILKFLQQRRQH